MGRRGPQPQPTAIKEARGNPGKRPLNQLEPKTDKGVPKRPAGLTPGARAAWHRIVPELHRMGVIGTIDAAKLEMWCVWYDRWRRLVRTINEVGEVAEWHDTMNNRIVYTARPETTIAGKLYQQLITLGRDFGLTPSSRSAIKINKEAEDPLAAFMAGGSPLRLTKEG